MTTDGRSSGRALLWWSGRVTSLAGCDVARTVARWSVVVMSTLALSVLTAVCRADDGPATEAAPPAKVAEAGPSVGLEVGLQRVQAVLDGYRVQPGAAGVARMKYAALAAHRQVVEAAVGYFAQTDPATLLDAPSRQAYWMNGYNVSMINAVLNHWGGDPTWSVSADGYAVFSQRVHSFGGHKLALNDIEHGVLRGDLSRLDAAHPELAFVKEAHQQVWGGRAVDPRIHVALNCASVGCPSLPARALSPQGLDAQLSRLSRDFVNDRQRGAGPAGISQLFEWYAADFPEGAEAFIKAHRNVDGPVKVDAFIPYDWSLNVARQ